MQDNLKEILIKEIYKRNRYALCTAEKYHIIFNPENATLNKNDEFFKPCIHKKFMLLDKT